MSRLLVALMLCLLAGGACAFAGVVTRVSDGDTLWVRPDSTSRMPIKLRLQGVDAPELCQPWGEQAGSALAARVLNRRVEVATRGRDDYRRTIAAVYLGGDDIAAWMVAEGHAWSTRWRGRHGRYASEEQAARAARRGLHARPDAIAPWRFRKMHGPCS